MNKKILLVFLMLSVFAVGTMNFIVPVEAATWKKFDSGSFIDKKPISGFTNKMSYTSYIKGSKEIKVNFYGYSAKTNKKILFFSVYLTKTGNKIKLHSVDITGKKSKPEYMKFDKSVKQGYKKFISAL